MALVAFTGAGAMWMPPLQASSTGFPQLRAGPVLDAVGEQHAIYFEVSSKSDGKTIDRIGLRVQTVTTSDNIDARLETVDDTNGEPSGTLATTNSNKSQTVSSSGWNEFVLTATHGPVTHGDKLAVVIEVPSGSTANILTGEHRSIPIAGAEHPYDLKSAGAGYVKTGMSAGNAQNPSIAVGFSDGTWETIPGSSPIVTLPSDSLTSTGTPSEVGLEFQIPFSAAISEVQFTVDPNAAEFRLNLGNASYNPGDSGATRLATRLVDPDILKGNSTATSRIFQLGSSVDLTINTTFRMTIAATTTTAILVYSLTTDDAAILSFLPGGTTWKYIEDNGAGGWTETTNRIPLVNLGFTKFDDGTGGAGGGLLVHPGMTGGIRG